MPCTNCSKDPTFHNFEFLLRNSKGDAIYFTSPSRGKARKLTESELDNYFSHMDEASMTSWVWIIDCKGMDKFDMPNPGILRKFMESIQERYKFVLKEIFIVNMNWKMSMILQMVRPFMKEEAKKRLIICDSPLQLLHLGLGSDTIKSFTHSATS